MFIQSVTMLIRPLVSLSLLLIAGKIAGKGLYTGVPCHLSYHCILENNDVGFDSSVLLASHGMVKEESSCQVT